MADWQSMNTAPTNGQRILLCTTYPKARYKIVVGAWSAKFNEWQSSPGAWPMKPTAWMPLPELPGML